LLRMSRRGGGGDKRQRGERQCNGNSKTRNQRAQGKSHGKTPCWNLISECYASASKTKRQIALR
jgi:hypothetical protein